MSVLAVVAWLGCLLALPTVASMTSGGFQHHTSSSHTTKGLKKVLWEYPVEYVAATSGTSLKGSLTPNTFSCISNQDYHSINYVEAFFCMLPYNAFPFCTGIWGSRSVVVTVSGNAEFVKHYLLDTWQQGRDHAHQQGYRWLEVQSSVHSEHHQHREIVQLPAESIEICGRSNDIFGRNATYEVVFREAFLREKDQRNSYEQVFYHLLLVAVASSMWLLPYLVALHVGIYSFIHGIQYTMTLLGICTCVVCLTPFMLTKKNRHLARLYLSYYFTRGQLSETKLSIRQKKPLFHALYFASVLLCSGSMASYIIYHYVGIDRELRNLILKLTIGVSISWFAFFLSRSFERFFSDWLWIAFSVNLGKALEIFVNQSSKEKIGVSLVIWMLLISSLMRKLLKNVKSLQ